jgi:WD40 repeat protein
MANYIDTTIFPSRLRLKPGGSLATFEVTVINESNQFAAFQLEVLAPGYATDPGRNWYRTEPKISSKKPPGDRTLFSVTLIDAPVPGFIGRLELIVRVFSLEFSEESRKSISVDVEPGESYLIVELPAPRLQAYPRNPIDIPVRIYNPRRQVSDVALNLVGLDSTWMPNGTFQQRQIPAGQQAILHFRCQPPDPLKAPCADYPFAIEVMPSDGLAIKASGVLELLPAGFVEFSCDQKLKQSPEKRGFFISWKSPPITYKLQLENTSNLWQDIDLTVHGKDHQRCKTDLIPENQILDPGEKAKVDLVVHKRRPWLGLMRRLLLEAEVNLRDTANVNSQVVPNPKAHLLELRVFPIIPPWLQAVIALLLMLLLWWLTRPPVRHLEPVTTVQISGDAGTVLSGSRDQTIHRWGVNEDHLETDGNGILARTDKAVRVIRYRPRDNDFVAAGLENGEIQFWNILSGNKSRTLTFFKDDRVFGLDFSKDSRFLYSGHGSGRVLEWDLEVGKKQPLRQKYVGFAVYAIALSESESPGQRFLLISGQFNQLGLWDLQTDRFYRIKYEHQNPEIDTDFSGKKPQNPPLPIAGKDDYIGSIATAGNIMVTADTQGYITSWNLAERNCSGFISRSGAKIPSKKFNPKNTICQIPILNQWRDGHQNKPVRSVALTSNGCYLASTGDDGRIMLWPLTAKGQRIPQTPNVRPEIVVDSLKGRLNSVDVIIRQGNILVANDDYDNRIRFYRLPEKGLNPFCQKL